MTNDTLAVIQAFAASAYILSLVLFIVVCAALAVGARSDRHE